MKQYGDEDFIFLIKEEAEADETKVLHENNIQNGYVILHDEKITFQEFPVIKGEFSMVLPEMFEPMPKNLAELKYQSANRPDIILTNPATTINLTFSYKTTKMREEETEVAKDAIQKVIMKLHPESSVIESKVIHLQNMNIAYFDFVTPAIDSDIYNFMFFFSLKERMMMGAFNCLEQDQYDWKELFIQMLESVCVIS